jgi:hypothetical protein
MYRKDSFDIIVVALKKSTRHRLSPAPLHVLGGGDPCIEEQITNG